MACVAADRKVNGGFEKLTDILGAFIGVCASAGTVLAYLACRTF